MTQGHSDRPALGALLVTGAAFMFATMGMLIRLAAGSLPNEMVVFLRNLFGLLILLPVLLAGRPRIPLATRRPGLHLVRSLFGLGAMYCFFYALSKLPLADAVLLNFTAPLFIPFVAALWLGERITPRLGLAALIGFGGVLLILRPGGAQGAAAAVGLASGAFAAVAMVALRRLSASEPALRVVVWYGVICTLASVLPLPWRWQAPEPEALLLMAGAGLFATTGQYLLSRGYGCAPAAQVGPFTYTSVIFAALWGWLLWREQPDLATAAGSLLVAAAGVLAMRR